MHATTQTCSKSLFHCHIRAIYTTKISSGLKPGLILAAAYCKLTIYTNRLRLIQAAAYFRSYKWPFSIDPLQCTLHDVVRRAGARRRDLSTSENLGSKLNRKCKTCFNCFLSVFICIDEHSANNMSSIIVNNTQRN